MAKKPILTLDAMVPDHEIVSGVFGKEYELLDYEDVGIVLYSRMVKEYGEINEMAARAKDLSDKELTEFDARLTTMVQKVLMGISAEDAARLSIDKKQKVLAIFFGLATKKLKAATMELESETNPITEN